jgi:2-polyprenyl-3-methyl-5-hydroxy-6-metoxy-1,4-benzoquinol methylase
LTSDDLLCCLCKNPITISEKGLFDTRFGIDALYSTAKCGSCGLQQITPIPTAMEIRRLYERFYNFCGENNTQYTRMRSFFFSSFLYQLWLVFDGDISFHSKRGKGRLLDIGCNEGRGLILYRGNGFTVEGLELNRAAATVARASGFTVYTELLEEFRPDELYDVVVLSNVIEHSLEPLDMLAHVSRMLKPGGSVWVSCPNNNSWLRKLFGKYWINWHVPFHIFHFTKTSLARALSLEGFTVTTTSVETPALWVSHSLLSLFFSRRGFMTKHMRNPFLVVMLTAIIRGLFFPAMWIANKSGHGDCLIVTARKDTTL